MNTNSSIKWGIAGLGKIAARFAKDLNLVENAHLEMVASRSINKAQLFAEKHGANKYVDSYNALFEDESIDIVYIATPHNLHAKLTVLALKNNKAVLCEKPFAINKNQVLAMISASKEHQTFLMEAMWTRFIPVIEKIKELIDANEIGTIKYLNADFSFKANIDTQRIYDKKLGGGSLLDVGIYPIFLAYLFLGKPKEILAKAHFFETGADAQLAMLFDYPEAQAVLFSSFNSNSKRLAKISGTLGEIIIDAPSNEPSSFKIIKNGVEKSFVMQKKGKGFTYEIQEANQCIRENRIESNKWSHHNSMELITLLDDVRKEIGLHYEEDDLFQV